MSCTWFCFPQVRVWSMDTVMDDTDDSKPRLLATLTDHFGSVNVVRFSPDGRLLASGSDDKAVLIYKLEPSSGGAPPRGNFGSSDPPPLENWKLCQTLKVREQHVCFAGSTAHLTDDTSVQRRSHYARSLQHTAWPTPSESRVRAECLRCERLGV
jgi:WD40 repeat protein